MPVRGLGPRTLASDPSKRKRVSVDSDAPRTIFPRYLSDELGIRLGNYGVAVSGSRVLAEYIDRRHFGTCFDSVFDGRKLVHRPETNSSTRLCAEEPWAQAPGEERLGGVA